MKLRRIILGSLLMTLSFGINAKASDQYQTGSGVVGGVTIINETRYDGNGDGDTVDAEDETALYRHANLKYSSQYSLRVNSVCPGIYVASQFVNAPSDPRDDKMPPHIEACHWEKLNIQIWNGWTYYYDIDWDDAPGCDVVGPDGGDSKAHRVGHVINRCNVNSSHTMKIDGDSPNFDVVRQTSCSAINGGRGGHLIKRYSEAGNPICDNCYTELKQYSGKCMQRTSFDIGVSYTNKVMGVFCEQPLGGAPNVGVTCTEDNYRVNIDYDSNCTIQWSLSDLHVPNTRVTGYAWYKDGTLLEDSTVLPTDAYSLKNYMNSVSLNLYNVKESDHYYQVRWYIPEIGWSGLSPKIYIDVNMVEFDYSLDDNIDGNLKEHVSGKILDTVAYKEDGTRHFLLNANENKYSPYRSINYLFWAKILIPETYFGILPGGDFKSLMNKSVASDDVIRTESLYINRQVTFHPRGGADNILTNNYGVYMPSSGVGYSSSKVYYLVNGAKKEIPLNGRSNFLGKVYDLNIPEDAEKSSTNISKIIVSLDAYNSNEINDTTGRWTYGLNAFSSFEGWFIEKDYTDEITKDTYVDDRIKMMGKFPAYAKWDHTNPTDVQIPIPKREFIVKFDAEGGKDATTGNDVVSQLKYYFTFDGWGITPDKNSITVDTVDANENYHIHDGNSKDGGDCYSPTIHKHIGNSNKYGGCYTKVGRHTHTGSATTGTGCYTKPIYHRHKGSTDTPGECYTQEIHYHVGSEDNGGPNTCYTKMHIHSWEQCYAVVNGVQMTCPLVKTENGKDYWSCGVSSNVGADWHDCESSHFICGLPLWSFSCNWIEGQPCPAATLTCNISELQPQSYEMNCGLVNNAVTGYSVNCGKDENTIDSWKFTCPEQGYVAEPLLADDNVITVDEILRVGNNYSPTSSYDLYAQWSAGLELDLPQVNKPGYVFLGWFTVPQSHIFPDIPTGGMQGDTAVYGHTFDQDFYRGFYAGAGYNPENYGKPNYAKSTKFIEESVNIDNPQNAVTLYAWYNRKPIYADLYEGLFFEGQDVSLKDLTRLVSVFDYEDDYYNEKLQQIYNLPEVDLDDIYLPVIIDEDENYNEEEEDNNLDSDTSTSNPMDNSYTDGSGTSGGVYFDWSRWEKVNQLGSTSKTHVDGESILDKDSYGATEPNDTGVAPDGSDTNSVVQCPTEGDTSPFQNRLDIIDGKIRMPSDSSGTRSDGSTFSYKAGDLVDGVYRYIGDDPKYEKKIFFTVEAKEALESLIKSTNLDLKVKEIHYWVIDGVKRTTPQIVKFDSISSTDKYDDIMRQQETVSGRYTDSNGVLSTDSHIIVEHYRPVYGLDTSTSRLDKSAVKDGLPDTNNWYGEFDVIFQVTDGGILHGNTIIGDALSDYEVEGTNVSKIEKSSVTLEYKRRCRVQYNQRPIIYTSNLTLINDFDSDLVKLKKTLISNQIVIDAEDSQTNIPWWVYKVTMRNLEASLEIVRIKDITVNSGLAKELGMTEEQLVYELNTEITSLEELYEYKNSKDPIKIKKYRAITSFGVVFDAHDQFGKYASGDVTPYRQHLDLPDDEYPDPQEPEPPIGEDPTPIDPRPIDPDIGRPDEELPGTKDGEPGGTDPEDDLDGELETDLDDYEPWEPIPGIPPDIQPKILVEPELDKPVIITPEDFRTITIYLIDVYSDAGMTNANVHEEIRFINSKYLGLLKQGDSYFGSVGYGFEKLEAILSTKESGSVKQTYSDPYQRMDGKEVDVTVYDYTEN